MKKLFFLTVLILALLLVAACSSNDPAETTAPSTTAAATTTAPTSTTAATTTAPRYTVSFYNEEGTLLGTQTLESGAIPSYTYEKSDTAEWDYTLAGWSTTEGGDALVSLPAVTGSASYYAVITAEKRSYTLTFDTGDGSAIDPITREYGSTVTKPADPTLDGYRFVGWVVGSENGEEAEWPITLTGDITLYAVYNEQVDIKGLLSTLLSGYQLDPYSYIPESMRPGFSGTLIDPDDVPGDYAAALNIAAIPTVGHGEQWTMVLENLSESQVFFNALTAVEAASAAAISAFNNYFDANPADTAHHTFEHSIYDITVDFDGETLYFILEYTATFPVIGEQTAQIALSMEMESGEKTVRIQLGEVNALLYTVLEDSYTFAIRYLGVRRAYFSVARDEDGNVEGHIFEHLTISEVDISSAADFYISEDYVIAVGNKADGLLGFQNTICEIYSTETGAFLGYEVQETKELSIPIAGTIGVTFNTLWFDLSEFEGLTSIRYDADNGVFYLNGSGDAFEAMKVGGNILTNHKASSRRFDIELRTRYFYAYDANAESYVRITAEIPMLFVQEENYETLIEDIEDANDITVTHTADADDLTALQDAYADLVAPFLEGKDAMTADSIIEIIGQKVVIE